MQFKTNHSNLHFRGVLSVLTALSFLAGMTVAQVPGGAQGTTGKGDATGSTPPSRTGSWQPNTDIRPSSFQTVTPGETTAAKLMKQLGQPRQQQQDGEQQVLTYQVGPFPNVDFNIQNNVVQSITIELKEPADPATIAKELGIDRYSPVDIRDGEKTLGQAFPERCVVITFDGGKTPRVNRIILDSLTPEPFVMRAEANKNEKYESALADLRAAQQISPRHIKALVLEARLRLQLGQAHEAQQAVKRAATVRPSATEIRVLSAAIKGKTGQTDAAFRELQDISRQTNLPPEQAMEVAFHLGELLRTSRLRDLEESVKQLQRAIKIAKGLATSPRSDIRSAARKRLFDAHLSVAYAIAWGNWDGKQLAVNRWLANAEKVGEVLEKGGWDKGQLQLMLDRWRLQCLAGIDQPSDPTPALERVARKARDLSRSTKDPLKRGLIERELGQALQAGMTIETKRKNLAQAMQNGVDAAKLLAQNTLLSQSYDGFHFGLGQLYFELGAVEAIQRKNHKGAMAWFRKSLQFLEADAAMEFAADPGIVGERLVSIGVSAWHTGEKQLAIRVTKSGLRRMEAAVAEGKLKQTDLIVPFENLSQMLGKTGQAEDAQALARRAQDLKQRD